MDIVNAYRLMGTYRGAAELCDTTHKTVRRVVQRAEGGQVLEGRTPRPRNTDVVTELIADRVKETRARISAKRLLEPARADGYNGSDRNFRRAVAEAKTTWRRRHGRTYRLWVPVAGEHLVIDWGQEGDLCIFCAVMAWSRYRFVRFARNERRDTTLGMLAECFDELGGAPAMVLSDRMSCLKAGVVANVVVAHPDYVRFATHYAFRPDFCEGYDPESKGIVERLVGYAKSDLVVPAGGWDSLEEANTAAKVWCTEVNARVHSETQAAPAERLQIERPLLRPLPSLRPPLRRGERRKVDRLATVRFGSARYSVPSTLVGAEVEVVAGEREVVVMRGETEVARHPLVAPGEASIADEHYGGPRRPRGAIRPRSAAERSFLALGEHAEAFLRAAAAAGTPRLAAELAAIVELEAAWGREVLVRALERATTFRRFGADDVRSILATGDAAPTPAGPGGPLDVELPEVPTRSLAAYAVGAPR